MQFNVHVNAASQLASKRLPRHFGRATMHAPPGLSKMKDVPRLHISTRTSEAVRRTSAARCRYRRKTRLWHLAYQKGAEEKEDGRKKKKVCFAVQEDIFEIENYRHMDLWDVDPDVCTHKSARLVSYNGFFGWWEVGVLSFCEQEDEVPREVPFLMKDYFQVRFNCSENETHDIDNLRKMDLWQDSARVWAQGVHDVRAEIQRFGNGHQAAASAQFDAFRHQCQDSSGDIPKNHDVSNLRELNLWLAKNLYCDEGRLLLPQLESALDRRDFCRSTLENPLHVLQEDVDPVALVRCPAVGMQIFRAVYAKGLAPEEAGKKARWKKGFLLPSRLSAGPSSVSLGQGRKC